MEYARQTSELVIQAGDEGGIIGCGVLELSRIRKSWGVSDG